MNDLISVIIPVYNVEKYIDECLCSVLGQSYENLDIILVDDGSRDSSAAKCDEYAAKDRRVRVIHKQNGGLSSARNAGLEAAAGKYVTFADSDDAMSRTMTEGLYKILCDHEADISICSFTTELPAEEMSADGPSALFDRESALKELFRNRVIQNFAWGKLYKRDLFAEVRYPERMLYEDVATTYKIFARAERVAVTALKMYFYRQHAESITGNRFSKEKLDIFRALQMQLSFAEDNCPELCGYITANRTYNAIAFYNQMCRDGFENEDAGRLLKNTIKKGIGGFMLSDFPFRHKIYGLCAAFCPGLAAAASAALRGWNSK